MVIQQTGWSLSQRARLILYHQHPVSARTRFLRLRDGRVCAFDPLPSNAGVLPANCVQPGVIVHPAWLLKGVERWLGLAAGSLRLDSGFQEHVGDPDAPLAIYLARFAGLEPPFVNAHAHGCQFIPLTDARSLPAAELELLRRAYVAIMED